MSDEDDPPVEKPAPKVKASKPRVNVSRFEKRAAKIADTIRQAANWSLPDLEALPFVDTVKRDADRIGHSLAAVGEWFDPVGKLIDVVFGLTGPLAVFVGLSPTLQAARRAGIEKLHQRRVSQRRQAEEAQAEQVAEEDPNGMPWPNVDDQEPAEILDVA